MQSRHTTLTLRFAGGEADAGPATDASEWGEFAHKPGRRYHNFDDIRKEIIAETDRVAGKGKGIIPEPIGLRIFSPRVPNLTIIDLPGITKVPVGDQPPDIEVQTRRLCLQYLSQPNMIILAVSPANADIANSEALKMALEVDPDGERTVGVLTKVDLMDPGTDAREVLAGRVIPLRRGFVPVVARSQKDIQDSLPVAQGLARERMFFERHPAYRHMAARCGTQYLTRVLSTLLMNSVRTWLPQIRSEISLMTQSAEASLRELGDPVEAAEPREQGHLLLKLLSRFAQNFCDTIEGRVHADAGGDQLIDELFGGARIQEIIRTRFTQWTFEWEELMDSQLTDAEILMALRNSSGPRAALFIPEQAFVSLVRRQIVQLKELGRKLSDEVYDELRRVAERCEPPQLHRFGELREKAVEVVQNLLRRAFIPTVDLVDRLIDIELAHINTAHPDFIGAAGAFDQVRRETEAAAERGALLGGGRSAGGSGDGDYSDPEEDAGDDVASPVAGRAGGRGGRRSGAASGMDGNMSDDVKWALGQLGVNAGPRAGAAAGQHHRSRGSPGAAGSRSRGAAANGVAGATLAVGAAGGAEEPAQRFAPRVLKEMMAADGQVRPRGPMSPYVEVLRGGPAAYFRAAAAGVPGLAGLTGLAPSPPGPVASLQPSARSWADGGQQHGVGMMSRWASPGAASYGSQQGGGAAGHSGRALVVSPTPPLPVLIGPDDLVADEKERQEIRIIRVLLKSYLGIVRKNYMVRRFTGKLLPL